MILPVIVSLFLNQVLGTPIVGGQLSPIYKYPWLASIQQNDRHKCGGSIISNTAILTSAHCVKDTPGSFIVRVGSDRTDYGGTWHKVVAIRIHVNYNSSIKVINDVALIKVSPPIELGRYGAQIQLPDRGYVVPPGTNVTVIGWGLTSTVGKSTNYELMSATVHTIDSGKCARDYGDKTGNWMKNNHEICAISYQGGPCHGDSGGPLVTRDDIQIGIVAGGGLGCDTHLYPGIYQDVAHYHD